MSFSALLQIKMNSNFNIYSGFFCEIFSASLFHVGILWDKNHIKIFCSEIWVEMIFGWPTFKIMCNTPIFYFNFRCLIENQASNYRLLGASSYMYPLFLLKYYCVIQYHTNCNNSYLCDLQQKNDVSVNLLNGPTIHRSTVQ